MYTFLPDTKIDVVNFENLVSYFATNFVKNYFSRHIFYCNFNGSGPHLDISLLRCGLNV